MSIIAIIATLAIVPCIGMLGIAPLLEGPASFKPQGKI